MDSIHHGMLCFNIKNLSKKPIKVTSHIPTIVIVLLTYFAKLENRTQKWFDVTISRKCGPLLVKRTGMVSKVAVFISIQQFDKMRMFDKLIISWNTFSAVQWRWSKIGANGSTSGSDGVIFIWGPRLCYIWRSSTSSRNKRNLLGKANCPCAVGRRHGGPAALLKKHVSSGPELKAGRRNLNVFNYICLINIGF